MQKILSSAISLIILASFLIGAPVTEKEADPIPSENPSGKKLIIHIVKRGDTVKSIAKKYESRVKWILDANQITDPEKIKVGEKISVPQKNLWANKWLVEEIYYRPKPSKIDGHNVWILFLHYIRKRDSVTIHKS